MCDGEWRCPPAASPLRTRHAHGHRLDSLRAVAHLSWLESGTIGLLQGVTELFPVSSLGHAVLLPAVVGGSRQRDLNVRAPESPYLAFIVGLHVATAIALLVYFWRDWVRIVRGLVTSIARREIRTADQRLAWMLVLATIPVGVVGLVAEHAFRTTLSRPVPTAIFLAINGVILLAIERFRPTAPTEYVDERVSGPESDERVARLSVRRAVGVGAAQILALAPGISRSGVATSAGMIAGLDRGDAARFSFLLATPVILAAGVLKIGDLTGPLGDGIRGQVLFGSVLAGVGAYVSVRFLTRYLARRSLRPFGVYCLVAAAASLTWFAVR